jgi:WD40 repeat protein
LISSFIFKVVIGSDNGTIEVYNANYTLIKSFQAHPSAIYRLKQSPFNNNIGIQNYIIMHYFVKIGLTKSVASLILTFLLA